MNTKYLIALCMIATLVAALFAFGLADLARKAKFRPSSAMADDLKEPLQRTYIVDSLLAIELQGIGQINKFVKFDLTHGANAVLHGYAPQPGDVIEWYVESAKCTDPEVSCVFELSIRKKQ